MICDCLPIVGVLLSETFLPTGRLTIGRGAPAQANSQRNNYFSVGKVSLNPLYN
jgi:hypothetical protein